MLLKCILNNVEIPVDSIENLIFEQSIDSPIITGSFTLLDTLYTKYKWIPENDEYQVDFKVYDIVKDETKHLHFNVSNINGGKVQEENEITIEFESYYAKDLLTNEITDYFDNFLISNIAIDIFKKSNIKTDFVSSTNNKLNITFPYLTGFEILKYLKPRMVDKKLRGGYLFFPDLFTQQMNIVNYYNLWNGDIQNYDQPLAYPEQNSDEYIGNCSDLEKVKTFNLKESVDGLNKQFESFSLKEGKINKSNIKAKSILNSDKNNYKDILLNLSDLSNTNKTTLLDRNVDELNNLVNTKYYNALNSLYEISVDCRGDWNRKVGALVSLITIKENVDGLIPDNKTSGMYIIKKIQHLVSIKNYSQKILLGKNGVILESD